MNNQNNKAKNAPENTDQNPDKNPDKKAETAAVKQDDLPLEYGGRKGPEPTRYGDWENDGIISDF